MAIYKCKMCGGTLEITDKATVVTCDYCGTPQTLPKLEDDRRANLYDRANHFRRNNEFDKAMGIYEQILTEDKTDAEAYWSLILCRYGIEYVEDPATHRRIPTINRAQFTSVFDDDNYKSALQYADSYQRHIYEEEAKAINEIQKGILAISQKEEPFDVFICYKETDRNGRRTPDSVLANDLYHQLIQEGFKVFFARITLEDKLGSAYEPYIFAALNSAKVMVVLGTQPEFFNAVWVKNEWSRYLSLIKQGQKKMLIPAYKDMDPYDLPEEFSHLQAQDMSKLGFMQDLIRGIKKIVTVDTPTATTVVKETVVTGGGTTIAPLLKRAFMFLEDGEWEPANEYCEKVLDIDPECAEAYLGKLLADLHARKQDDLKNAAQPFDRNGYYQKAMRFGDDKLKATLAGYIEHITTRNENARLSDIYTRAKDAMSEANTQRDYTEAAQLFESISDYRDSAALAKECYESAEIARKDAILAKGKGEMTGEVVGNYEFAIQMFASIPGWKDADERVHACRQKIEEIKAKEEAKRLALERHAEQTRKENERKAKRNKIIVIAVLAVLIAVIAFVIVLTKVIIPNNKYNDAVALMEAGKYERAISAFEELDGYKDSVAKIQECNYNHAVALMEAGEHHKAALLFSRLSGYKDAKEKFLSLWKSLALENPFLSAGENYTIGLKADGTVVATGDNSNNQCDVSDWKDITAVSAGSYHTVGLKADGTVVATGDNFYDQCNVGEWKDIIAIAAGDWHTVGLKADGTVVAVGYRGHSQCDVGEWKGIIAIAAGSEHTIGLKADGTVVAAGYNDKGECTVGEWKDIIAIATGSDHTVGLKIDGTVVAEGDNFNHQCDIDQWKDITAIAAGAYHTVGLKVDGTVVAVGYDTVHQCDVYEWKDIVAIAAGAYHTIGLKADGTVVAVGKNDVGQCDVNDWSNIRLPK